LHLVARSLHFSLLRHLDSHINSTDSLSLIVFYSSVLQGAFLRVNLRLVTADGSMWFVSCVLLLHASPETATASAAKQHPVLEIGILLVQLFLLLRNFVHIDFCLLGF